MRTFLRTPCLAAIKVMLFSQYVTLILGGGGVTTLWVLVCILACVSVVIYVFYRRVGAQLIGGLIQLDG